MYSTIKLECIRPKAEPTLRELDRIFGLGFKECVKPRHWVAEIVGLDPKYTFKRVFLSQKRDFSKSNSVGSRGVYANYMLEYGKVFEVSDPKSWRRIDRYFLLAGPDDMILSKEEVVEWLKIRSE
jgi:hypothetical protein